MLFVCPYITHEPLIVLPSILIGELGRTMGMFLAWLEHSKLSFQAKLGSKLVINIEVLNNVTKTGTKWSFILKWHTRVTMVPFTSLSQIYFDNFFSCFSSIFIKKNRDILIILFKKWKITINNSFSYVSMNSDRFPTFGRLLYAVVSHRNILNNKIFFEIITIISMDLQIYVLHPLPPHHLNDDFKGRGGDKIKHQQATFFFYICFGFFSQKKINSSSLNLLERKRILK